ncbi:hypothetical protein CDD83_2941 [Cordyceps sp. RAO-2017]|nr:hypothetical protein CDD83_2941 [Cordyceps sp. RAO-2017]
MLRTLFLAAVVSSSLALAQFEVETIPGVSFRPSNYTSHAKVQASKNVSSIFNNDPIEAAKELSQLVLPQSTPDWYKITRDHYTSSDNVTHIYFTEAIRQGGSRLKVKDADFVVNVKDGKIFSYGETFLRDHGSATTRAVKRNELDPLPALKRVIEVHGLNVSTDRLQAQPVPDREGFFVFEGADESLNPPSAEIVLCPNLDGKMAPAWKVKTYYRLRFLATFLDVDKLEVLEETDYALPLDGHLQCLPLGR